MNRLIQLFQQYSSQLTQDQMSKNKDKRHGIKSTTSIQQPNSNKIDGIIVRLQKRKKQLVDFLQNKQKQIIKKQPLINVTKGESKNNWCCRLQRRKKYEQKIYDQLEQKNKLIKQTQKLQSNLISLVVQLQNNEIKLKTISRQIGDKYRNSIGIYQQGCIDSPKWIYHQIFQLQSQIKNKQLQLKSIICQFYHHQNFNTLTDYRSLPPNFCFFNYIVVNRLVNKLYGVILNKKVQMDDSKQEHSSQDQQQNYTSQQQTHEIQEQKMNTKQKDQKIWLQILKLLKRLQKLSTTQTNNCEQQECKKKYNINIQLVQEQVNKLIDSSRKIKKSYRQQKQKIKYLKQRKQLLFQQIKIKEQFIEGIVNKINKIDFNIEQNLHKQIENQNNLNSVIDNPEKVVQATRKQLKQVQEAIRYFTIKKNTILNSNHDLTSQHTIKVPLQNTQIQYKSIQSLSPFLSPHKSTANILSQNKYLSPDRKQSQKNLHWKYSLKDLLTPPKQLSTIEKRQAWK